MRGKPLQAQLNLTSEERSSGGENKKRTSGGALLEGLPHGNVKSEEKSFPANIFLSFTVKIVVKCLLEAKCVFPKIYISIHGRDFSTSCSRRENR